MSDSAGSQVLIVGADTSMQVTVSRTHPLQAQPSCTAEDEMKTQWFPSGKTSTIGGFSTHISEFAGGSLQRCLQDCKVSSRVQRALDTTNQDKVTCSKALQPIKLA